MARVFIDCHMFSESWFREVLSELLKSDSVFFSYGLSPKLENELGRVRQALEFFKQVGAMKTADNRSRRVDADISEIKRHIEILEGSDCYKNCNDCDDSHIFAIIYAKPTPYVFSMDSRMASCRDKINRYLDKRYCKFSVISSNDVYRVHRAKVLS